jgi:hypothetical protein
MPIERQASAGRRDGSIADEPETEPETPGFEHLFVRIRDEIETFARSVAGIAVLEWQRFKLRVVGACMGLAALVLLLASVAAVAIAASVLLVTGTRDALVAWTGTPWIGEIGAGALVLGGLLLGGALLRRITRRRLVAAAVRPRPAREATPSAAEVGSS